MAPVSRVQEGTVEGGKWPKITVYWLDRSRSQRVLWLLEELQLEYELKTFKRDQNMLAPPEAKEIHPLGKFPIVTIQSDATAKPITIAESGFIIEYLADHFGAGLMPERYQKGKEGQVGGETEEWMRYSYLMHYGEGSLMPMLVMMLVMRSMREKSPFFIRPLSNLLTGAVESNFINPALKTNFEYLEDQLASSPNNGKYLCGANMTAADIFICFPLSAARGRAGLTREKYPNLWDYVERLEGREAFQKAIQKIIDVEGSYDPSL